MTQAERHQRALERRQQVLALREQGATWARVGEQLGISYQAAQRLAAGTSCGWRQITQEEIAQVVELRQQGLSLKEIGSLLGHSGQWVWRRLDRHDDLDLLGKRRRWRPQDVVLLRREGLTIRAIAKQLNMSYGNCRDLLEQAVRNTGEQALLGPQTLERRTVTAASLEKDMTEYRELVRARQAEREQVKPEPRQQRHHPWAYRAEYVKETVS